MLIDQAKQVQSDVESLQKARRNLRQRERFRDRRKKLRGLVRDIIPLADTLRVLSAKGIAVNHQGQNLEPVLDSIEEVQKRFRNDPAWIIRPENDLSDLERWIRKHRGKIQRKLQAAWSDYYQQQVPDLSEDLLGVMEQFEDFRGAVQAIRKYSSTLQKWSDSPPQTENAFSTFQDLAERRRATWRQLRSADMSEEVLDFLVSAGTDGATVDQLTAEVRTWLETNDLLDRVRIRLKE